MSQNTRASHSPSHSDHRASCAAFAPATVANIGVGFDILGLALAEPGDTVTAYWSDQPGIQITGITGDQGRLPREAARNTAGVAAASVWRAAQERAGEAAHPGITLDIHKGLPLGSGLGSSAASAVAAAVAVNALLGEPLSRAELLPACLDGEALVSGRHADNVAPALFGGIVLAYGIEADQIRDLPIPAHLHLALVTPHVEVLTSDARSALPAAVPLKVMVAQTGAVARLIDALYRQDLAAMAAAMESDGIIEPARAHLMPYLSEVRAAAKRAGALGLVISGAGPTLLAVCDQPELAQQVSAAMGQVYAEHGMGCQVSATRVSAAGAYLL